MANTSLKTKGYAAVYLDDDNCRALVVTSETHSFLSGITKRNVHQLISNLIATGFDEIGLHEMKYDRTYRECHMPNGEFPELPESNL